MFNGIVEAVGVLESVNDGAPLPEPLESVSLVLRVARTLNGDPRDFLLDAKVPIPRIQYPIHTVGW